MDEDTDAGEDGDDDDGVVDRDYNDDDVKMRWEWWKFHIESVYLVNIYLKSVTKPPIG